MRRWNYVLCVCIIESSFIRDYYLAFGSQGLRLMSEGSPASTDEEEVLDAGDWLGEEEEELLEEGDDDSGECGPDSTSGPNVPTVPVSMVRATDGPGGREGERVHTAR